MPPGGERTRAAVTNEPEVHAGSWTAPRAAAAVFAAVEVGAFALWMTLARHEWFFTDEWAFLADRELGSIEDLFRDHNSHWSTVPIVMYRLLWSLFGLRTYLPYLAVVAALHLACAAMLRVVMRRAGAGPWVATVAASAFALLGTGYQDIVWAFQIGFDAALLLGLVALVLADLDGGLAHRDVFALVACVGALASSSVGLVMAGAVTLAVLVRRGWQIALVYGVTLGGTYAIWWFSIGHEGAKNAHPSPEDLARFVQIGVGAAFGALGQAAVVGALLAALAIAGAVLAVRTVPWSTIRRRWAAPFALALGALVFLVLSGYARVEGLGSGFARASRYVHIVVALLLPLIVVAVDVLARRWVAAFVVVVIVFIVGVPGNINELSDYTTARKPYFEQLRQTVLALPRAPLAKRVPRTVRPMPEHADMARVTIGWLLDSAAAGKVPPPGPTNAARAANVALRLSILQRPEHGVQVNGCRQVTTPIRRELRRGDSIVFQDAGIRVTTAPGSRPGPPASLTYGLNAGGRLTAVVPKLVLVIAPSSFFAPTVCNVG